MAAGIPTRDRTPSGPRPIVASQVWLETHFQYSCPECHALNEVASIGAAAYADAVCTGCRRQVHVRIPMPAQAS